MIREGNLFIYNGDVKIHCIICNPADQVPLIVVPGAINSAEEVFESLKGNLKIFHIIISLRGRGQSNSPVNSYSLEAQASDIIAVINYLKLESFFLFGHSLGSTIGIKAVLNYPDRIKGLIIGDFPPVYPQYSSVWADRVLARSRRNITQVAINGIVADAIFTDLSLDLKKLNCLILIIRGALPDSLLREEQTEKLRALGINFQEVVISESGHELWLPEPQRLCQLVEDFLSHILP